jgi:hypothetical protein
MLKKYNNWYISLTPFKRLVVSFILNGIYWLLAWLIAEQFFFDNKRSWKYHVFHATWMSTCVIILFNWKDLKQIFKPKHKEEERLENDA